MSFIRSKLNGLEMNPPRILALGFMTTILLGALLLNLPRASVSGESIGFIDALFTSASAVCVTGLVVVNTADHWTVFGQAVILMLIQIGGLGIMTMATIFALVSGKKISLKERLVIKEQLNQESLSGLVKLVKYVIAMTLFIEFVGAVVLSYVFIPEFGLKQGIWNSLFHSVSAFCNAGFDITGNSFMDYNDSTIAIVAICFLVVVGGLGFSVIIDILRHRSWKRLSLHTRLVIIISFLLLAIGTLLILVLEWNNPGTLKDMTLGDKVRAALFAAVVPRTAGFNSIDVGAMMQATAFFTIILMFIGGSPGSTAGGIKTATFGVVIMATIAIIKGERDIEIYKKRIPQETVFKSLAIVTVGMGMIIGVSFLLTLTESWGFLDTMFEATSAFATVGLSRGLTPNLSNAGKLIIIGTMYAGRVGPLTMAFAFGYNKKHKRYRYSEGHITVG
ncbi:TrkH family potassium uptake protein [Gudongella oleilytica]|uniref:TrkH family potassium uptake protein n=1 Tax=Gudongella oleilytica TaxID=1582259 RepID=UPI002A36BCB2|nr:TrkH family potassium uptake protein [Gudongella oleilytica]MDY0257515.1 TrkH family potassium uptake protein [Gudongella oleilytica]